MSRHGLTRFAFGLVALIGIVGTESRAERPSKPRGEKYALLVAVRKYSKSSELRELHYTERDMEELAQVLRTGGYRPENVVLLTQTAGAEDSRLLPTADHIRKELKALLRDRIGADSVLVAFAGHGLQFRGSDETYFCPADARPDDRHTLLSLDEVYRALAECEAQFKLLLSDACRNDPIAAVSRRATVNLNSVTRPQLQRPPGGVASLFSCSVGELAYESDTLKHGVFFHFVIEGLRGAADFDRDGQIELEELTFFTKRRVLDFVRAEYDGVRQMPVLKGEVGGLPVLVSLDRLRIPVQMPPAPISGPRKAEVSWDTDRDRAFVEFLRDKSGGMIRKAAVAIERRGDLRIALDQSVAPEDTLPLTKSILAGARKDFPDRPITLSVYDPAGAPILKALYRPGQGVQYQIAHGGLDARKREVGRPAEPSGSEAADPLARSGVTEADRKFAAWAEEHGHAFLRYVQADLERHGRLWFGVTRDVKPADVPELTKSLLQGAQKEFPRRDLVAAVFDPEGERIGKAHLGADGQVRWEH